jgi:hypothetical protein
MARQRWIIVPNWDRFQHYKDRNPPWIKNYTELLHDDAYLALSFHQRGVLHGIWLAYAAGHRQLIGDTSALHRQLGQRVTTATLIALNHAGFIEVRASKPLASRARARTRSQDELLRSSKEAASATRRRRAPAASQNGPPPCPECGVGQGLHASDCSKAGIR